MVFRKTLLIVFVLLCSVIFCSGCNGIKEAPPEDGVVMVESPTEEEILAAFLKARDASMWSSSFSLDDINDDIIWDVEEYIVQGEDEYAPYTYYGMASFAELEAYLKQIFTEELVEEILNPQMNDGANPDFIDIDGRIYVNVAWDYYPDAETKNIVILPQQDGSYEIVWTLLKYDEDSGPEEPYISGEEESFHFTYAYTGDGWRFTKYSFPKTYYFQEDRENLWVVYENADKSVQRGEMTEVEMRKNFYEALEAYVWYMVADTKSDDPMPGYSEGAYNPYCAATFKENDTPEELAAYLKTIFSERIVADLTDENSSGCFRFLDDKIYAAQEWGGNVTRHETDLSVEEKNDGSYTFMWTLSVLDPDTWQPTGETETFPAIYGNMDGNWVFMYFPRTPYPFVYLADV